MEKFIMQIEGKKCAYCGEEIQAGEWIYFDNNFYLDDENFYHEECSKYKGDDFNERIY